MRQYLTPRAKPLPSLMPNLNEIDEEDEDYYNEVFIEELENGNMGE